MKKRYKAFGVLAASGALLLGTVLPASAADEAPIGSDTVEYLTESFAEIGVDPDKFDTLLEKYAAGEVFDNSSGAAPISVETYRLGITDYNREIFADGSVTRTSVERPTTPTPKDGITPFGISGCKYTLSAGVASYQNCKVDKNNGVLTMMFHANYWRTSSASGVSLTNSWDWDIQAAGGACSKDSLGTPTKNKARLRAYCTVVTGIGSSYPYLDLNVTPSGATIGTNW